jgi:septal ring factor EnvC (AmiA/AmiB activator)
LKKNYKDLSDDKLRGNAKFEARIEQYNTEIRENKEENEKLQNRIKDLEEEIDETIGHYNKEIEKIITSNKAEIHSLN